MKFSNTNLSERGEFLDAMSRVPASVSIVTTGTPEAPFGLTVSSLVSISADTERPTLLVSVHKDAETLRPLMSTQKFCVNLLHVNQEFDANLFAGRNDVRGVDRFDHIKWRRGAQDVPVLEHALVNLECQVSRIIPIGQHMVVFGEVQHIALNEGGPALLYAERNYAVCVPAKLTEQFLAA